MTCHSHLHFPGVLRSDLLIELTCLKEKTLSSELFPLSDKSFSRMAALASFCDGLDLAGEVVVLVFSSFWRIAPRFATLYRAKSISPSVRFGMKRSPGVFFFSDLGVADE